MKQQNSILIELLKKAFKAQIKKLKDSQKYTCEGISYLMITLALHSMYRFTLLGGLNLTLSMMMKDNMITNRKDKLTPKQEKFC